MHHSPCAVDGMHPGTLAEHPFRPIQTYILSSALRCIVLRQPFPQNMTWHNSHYHLLQFILEYVHWCATENDWHHNARAHYASYRSVYL